MLPQLQNFALSPNAIGVLAICGQCCSPPPPSWIRRADNSVKTLIDVLNVHLRGAPTEVTRHHRIKPVSNFLDPIILETLGSLEA
jgi:hypothetical protein